MKNMPRQPVPAASFRSPVFFIGHPTLPVAALLISQHLIKKAGWSVPATAVLLSGQEQTGADGHSLMLLFSGFKCQACPWGLTSHPPDKLQEGVDGSLVQQSLLDAPSAGW
jgi:hypothetical protein